MLRRVISGVRSVGGPAERDAQRVRQGPGEDHIPAQAARDVYGIDPGNLE